MEVSEVESFVERCMTAVGTPAQQAKALAEVLVSADKRGHFSHGLNRLGMAVFWCCLLDTIFPWSHAQCHVLYLCLTSIKAQM